MTPTQELSETETTRGASKDDLLIDPLEPWDVGEDRPCVPSLAGSSAPG
jgi:hypothetical protein